ncbi:hypothetical protein NC653_036316 [Populus alba x Populus x berolinensis]|uniref:MADS-box domain-containing protein n=1 Tax=Populus alba x Populus x berolinensis TaxID=444605 RepID=A0AAD6LJW8_9ROSI|nr:hypothetical protein NC653_036316 [Populus alba x Populus x berolinensis]
MARKKVKLMWIVNDAARKASLKKRRVGLLKKVSELTILCGIEAFVIIYSPDDPEPAFWPSRPDVQRLVTRFRNIPVMERCKKMMNQESYLKERMGKQNDQFRKHLKKNRDLEMADLMQQVYQDKGFDGLDQTQLCGLAWLVAEKMRDIRKRVEYFQQIPPLQDPSLPPGPFHPQYPNEDGDGDGYETGGQVFGEPGDGRNNPTDGGVPWDQWFNDIINNREHNVAGGSTTKSDLGLPHPFNIAGVSSGGGADIGFHPGHNDGGGSSTSNIFGLGLSRSRNIGDISGGNIFHPGLLPHDNDILRGRSSGGNNFDLGLPIESNMIGCNNAGNSFGPRLPRGLGFNPGGNTSAGNNFDLGLAQGNDTRSDGTGGNNYDLWLPHVKNVGGNSAAVNNVNPWPAAGGDIGGESLGLGLLPGTSFSGSGTGENPFHGLHGMRHRGNSGAGDSGDGGSDLGHPGFFGTGSTDLRLPFDVTKNWFNDNFNP